MANIRSVMAEYLELQGLTQREFAEQLGVSHPTVANWRDGKTQPGIDVLIQWSRKYEDWRRDFALDCLEARLGSDAFKTMRMGEWIWKDPGGMA